MRAILIGNYGVGNLGDEALKEYFLQQFPMVQWQVVSANPSGGELPRLPFGIRSLFSSWWRTVRAIHGAGAVVFGGGSLFTDVESVRACWLWWWHAFVAHLFGKKILLAYQGIGPFKTTIGKYLTKKVLGWALFISVRDAQSELRASAMHPQQKIVESFDPVLSLLKANNLPTNLDKNLVIIPRNTASETFTARCKELNASQDWDHVWILSMQPENTDEQKYCRQLSTGSKAITVPIKSLQELAEYTSRASFVLSQRYHGALAALALGKKFEVVVQKDGDKLSTLSKISLEEAQKLVKVGEEALSLVLQKTS